MSTLNFVTAERWTTLTAFAGNNGFSTSTSIPTVARDIFGFPDEKWFTLGSTTGNHMVKEDWAISTGAFEMSAAFNLGPNPLTPYTYGSSLSTFGFTTGTDNYPTGNYAQITSRGPRMNLHNARTNDGDDIGTQVSLSVEDGTGVIFNDLIPEFELQPGGLYYFTLRMKTNSANGVNDGAMEVWCNGRLLWDAIDANFDGTDLTQFHSHITAFHTETTYIRNMTWDDEFTTAVGTTPIFRNSVYLPDISVVSEVNYAFTEGTGATSVETALNDNDDLSAAITATPDSDLVLSIGNIPVEFANSDVLSMQFETNMYRDALSYSNPIITISDGVTDVATKQIAVDVVGPEKQNVQVNSIPVAAGTKLANINFTINSGL